MSRDNSRVPIALQLFVILCALCLSFRVAVADDSLVYETGVIEGLASDPAVISELPTIAVAADNRFILAWTTRYAGSLRGVVVRRFNDDGSALDTAPVPVATSQPQHKWYDPSLAIEHTASPDFRLAFSGFKEPYDQQNRVERVFILDYPLLSSPFSPPVAVGSDSAPPPEDSTPSIGSGDNGQCAASWTRFAYQYSESSGLLAQATCMSQPGVFLRSCSDLLPPPYCRLTQWQACVAMRGTGEYVVAWADAENPNAAFSAFNIAVQQFTSGGTAIGSAVTINQPVSVDDTSEISPAVAFRGNDIVVTWAGPIPDACTGQYHIYARRLRWNSLGSPDFDGDPFIVDNDASAQIQSPDVSNPTVALGPDGRLIIGWNTRIMSLGVDSQIAAQYFQLDADTIRPVAREFRVNQDTSITSTDDLELAANDRKLAESAQHTAAYGSDGRVVFAWQRGEVQTIPNIYFTILPSDYPAQLEAALTSPCLKGDCNYDLLVNGDDVQPFVNLLLGSVACLSVVDVCPFDTNSDASFNVGDIPSFVCLLLGNQPGCAPYTWTVLPPDCNTNNIDDAEDIASQTSEDCNSNGAPDECESLDCNTNNILDDCETAGGQSDCNSNFLPDECDLLYGPSFDCNTNGIPDECDLLGETSFDCNENLVPDECDIADATSEDSNSNGIPDECEQGQGRSMMAGEGDHSESDTGETPVPPDASHPYAVLPVKWQALMQWLDATDFSAMTPDEIDAALAAKMIELGLLGA